ncbi:MAG TPA: hypothetical protein VMZ49_05815 [Patescibacteria group bacterium]|nr:hypothetical protein [Patescibacteria group bacterium]
MAKRMLFALLLIVVVLFSNGCFNVRIEQDVDFPVSRFAEVRKKMAVMEKHNPERIGRVETMQVLVYDGQSRELVQVAVPMWMVGIAKDRAEKSSRRQPQDVAGRYIDFDLSHLGNISRLGPGLLVQVEDMRENTHVLVWLE